MTVRHNNDAEALADMRQIKGLSRFLAIVRRICQSISRRRKRPTSLISTKANVADGFVEKHSPRSSTNVMHPQTPQSPGTSSLSTTDGHLTDGDMMHEDDLRYASEFNFLTTSAPLSSKVFFFYTASVGTAEEEDRRLLYAASIESECGGMLRVVAEDSNHQPTYGCTSDLLVDARVHSEDEPRLLNLIGARVYRGQIERLYFDSTGNLCCDVWKKRQDEILQISIEQAVDEIRSLEKQRQNAQLERYQRQMCSSMMRNQRARFLDSKTQSCPY
jgi:hypothetical protein